MNNITSNSFKNIPMESAANITVKTKNGIWLTHYQRKVVFKYLESLYLNHYLPKHFEAFPFLGKGIFFNRTCTKSIRIYGIFVWSLLRPPPSRRLKLWAFSFNFWMTYCESLFPNWHVCFGTLSNVVYLINNCNDEQLVYSWILAVRKLCWPNDLAW